jgi:hypothetical protein
VGRLLDSGVRWRTEDKEWVGSWLQLPPTDPANFQIRKPSLRLGFRDLSLHSIRHYKISRFLSALRLTPCKVHQLIFDRRMYFFFQGLNTKAKT